MKKVSNPPNRYSPQILEWIDAPPPLHQEIYEEKCKSIIASNDSPDIPFKHSVNPYRGCHHGCAYCYARPTHQYIDFGAGTDFERKIVVKINAPEKLREAFMKKSWQGDGLLFSGVTDCYQPLEATYGLTRRCLEVCDEFQNPVSIITKGALIRRDIDLLQSLNSKTRLNVFISLAFSDDGMSRKIEPYAPGPAIRFRTIEALAKAGITVGIGIAPVIPALNDSQIPEILKKAADAGATGAFMTLLRLPQEVKDVFLANINENFPDRYKKVVNRIKAMRNGNLNQHHFGSRMTGNGTEWEAVKFLFESSLEKYGFNRNNGTASNGADRKAEDKTSTFRRPDKQISLFS